MSTTTQDPSTGLTAPSVRFEGLQLARAALGAASRGDRRGLIAAMAGKYGVEVAQLAPAQLALCDSLAELVLELRRENVAVIGSHEAFVRHTPDGSLHQVIRPVRLSTTEGTLFQIKRKQPICRNEQHKDLECFQQVIRGKAKDHKGISWEEVVLGDPNKGIVTFPGYLALNAVAGCAVGLPPKVFVDGEQRTNPYIERDEGEVVRIVISVTVVGPAPFTGNPVVVNYTLDYDPQKDLAHMLLNLRESDDLAESIRLVPRRLLKADDDWGHLTLAAGMSIRYDPSLPGVATAFSDYIEIQANALKKALTVARRNAMKSHPALGIQAVVVNADGVAIVPMVGWAGDKLAMRRWQEIQSALSKGLPLPEAEVIEHSEVYEPERDGVGIDADRDGESVNPELQRKRDVPVTAEVDSEVLAKNAIIQYIDQGIGMLSTEQAHSLGYDPEKMTIEELATCRARLDAILDQRK